MIVDFGHYSRVIKNILYFVLIAVLVYLILRLFIFFSPFLIGLLIANMLEPVIKRLMIKLNISRKVASIISLLAVFAIIFLVLFLLISTIISEASKLLGSLNVYIPAITSSINNIIGSINLEKLNLSDDIKNIILDSTSNSLGMISEFIYNILNWILQVITKLPEIGIYIVITFLATYFISSDRYYIKDQFEYHMPRLWLRKFNNHFREITVQLINYLKAEVIMVIISFIIVLVGLYILSFLGFDIGFPLIIAIFIGIVDALPILGSGSVLVPWAVISGLIGNVSLGIGLIIIYGFTLASRQLLEPKIVSNKIGIHPIFTLVAMYAGFKIIGFLGLIVGPIILIIYKNIFETLLERGFVKTIFEKD